MDKMEHLTLQSTVRLAVSSVRLCSIEQCTTDVNSCAMHMGYVLYRSSSGFILLIMPANNQDSDLIEHLGHCPLLLLTATVSQTSFWAIVCFQSIIIVFTFRREDVASSLG